MSSYQTLSEKYRSGKGTKSLTAKEKRAYLLARMPATLAAISEVLRWVPGQIHEMVDLGAGPGTGLLAAKEIFPYIRRATLIERDLDMVSLGKNLVELSGVEWVVSDLKSIKIPTSDLGLMAYVIGELEDPLPVIERAFAACQTLVLIEPGTPRGFERIRAARERLIARGGFVIAPCNSCGPCPMKSPDWCHFAARVSRTKEHKRAKGASLGYEDEKFSYLIVGKRPHAGGDGRILSRPMALKGHVKLKLCTENGIEERVITKKEGPLYKRARKLKWGELLPENIIEEGKQEAEDQPIEKAPNSSDNSADK